MMKKIYPVLVSLFVFMVVGVKEGTAQSDIFTGTGKFTGQQFAPGEIIVKYKPRADDNTIARLNARFGTKGFFKSRGIGFHRLKIPKGRSVKEMVEAFKSDPDVEYAEPNYTAHAHLVPDDPYYPYQWHLDNVNSGGIHMEAAWDVSTGFDGVVVAVVDTGVAYEDYTERVSRFRTERYYLAPDLAGTSFAPGYDFVNNDDHPNDDHGHGTHVTGTIAQNTDNALGVAGVAFNTTIMPVKVLDDRGRGYYSDIAEGIIFAADNGADVINMSLGGWYSSIALRDACAYAYERGVTLVCSAGNDGEADLSYPAAYDEYCIGVGATRYDETRAWYSNYGDSLDLMAPGGDLNVDQNQDGYGDGILQQTFSNGTGNMGYWFFQGTSMAAPHVSGVAALLIATGAASTPGEVREALQSTAKDLGVQGWDPDFGWGLLDAEAALEYSASPNTPPAADPGGPYSGEEDTGVQFDGSGSSDPDGDSLTYYWDFGDGAVGSGVNPVHAYAAGGHYPVTLVVNDGSMNSAPAATTADITEVNDPPVSVPGGPYSGVAGRPLQFNGSDSYDPDGNIAAYDWDFGDGSTGNGANPSHAYAGAGAYTVSLTVTDNGGATDMQSTAANIAEESAEVEVFSDSFEVNEWNGQWTEDSQDDWFRSAQRAVDGGYAAEVDGRAKDAALVSVPINLQGKPNARVTFSWYIDWKLDRNEYVAFDVSTNGGATWVERARLRGNADPEDQWHQVSVELIGISSLRLRFRGKMSMSSEDADVDHVRVVAW